MGNSGESGLRNRTEARIENGLLEWWQSLEDSWKVELGQAYRSTCFDLLGSVAKILQVLHKENSAESFQQIKRSLDTYSSTVKIAQLNLDSSLSKINQSLARPVPTQKILKELESLLWNEPSSVCKPLEIKKRYLARNCILI